MSPRPFRLETFVDRSVLKQKSYVFFVFLGGGIFCSVDPPTDHLLFGFHFVLFFFTKWRPSGTSRWDKFLLTARKALIRELWVGLSWEEEEEAGGRGGGLGGSPKVISSCFLSDFTPWGKPSEKRHPHHHSERPRKNFATKRVWQSHDLNLVPQKNGGGGGCRVKTKLSFSP